MDHALDIGAAVLAAMFLVLAIIRPSAGRKARQVQDRYVEDHTERFDEAPKLALTGLFPW